MTLHLRTVCTLRALWVLLLLTLPGVAESQSYTNNYGIWNYTTTNGAVAITSYHGPGGAVTIPSTINGAAVTSLGDDAFASCRSLISVTIPSTVTNLGSAAFTDCESLTSVIIPNGVTSIESYTFFGCLSLTNVMIPSGITNIGDYAFEGCRSLTDVTIPEGVAYVGGECFFLGDSLLAITVDPSNSFYSSIRVRA